MFWLRQEKEVRREQLSQQIGGKYTIDNLEFVQLDVTNGEEFGEQNIEKYSLVTSFSCLHWVNDHLAATKLTARVLKKGGKFLHLVSIYLNKIPHSSSIILCFTHICDLTTDGSLVKIMNE